MKKLLVIAIAMLFALATGTAQVVSPTPSPSATPTASPSGATAEAERVVVSGGEIERSETDTAQPVVIMNENSMKLATTPTLGDTLATEPGIGASGFTPGASRPVIRGQADNRIRVLNHGTEFFDVSN